MTNSNDDGTPRPQAVVAGDLDGAGTLNGRAGASVFSVGGTAAGANPYELLSASLAACTAMTIRLQARRRKIPLSHVEVAVSYHHGGDGARDSFERSITLEGNLVDGERAQLMQAANRCPVGRTLGLSADIRTNDNVCVWRAASYDDDLSELPIPNIDPDQFSARQSATARAVAAGKLRHVLQDYEPDLILVAPGALGAGDPAPHTAALHGVAASRLRKSLAADLAKLPAPKTSAEKKK